MKATNFDIRISRQAALELIKPFEAPYMLEGKAINCLLDELNMNGIELMNKEYSPDEDWVGLTGEEYELFSEDEEYQLFELWLPARKG